MFVKYDKGKMKNPILIWLENESQVEEECMQQAINLSNLPFIHKWVALMPDTHSGYGMPIGGVIATKGVIIPNAVGVDIGCGMAFVETNIHKSMLAEIQYKSLVGNIMRDIPTAFEHHKSRRECRVLDNEIWMDFDYAQEFADEVEKAYYQVGTLGGGNHFIELQEDKEGMLCIMVHSGSRNFGYKIANYFNDVAIELNKNYYSVVPESYELAFLPVESREGKAYINWMKLALGFAMENRQAMLDAVKYELKKTIPEIEFKNEVNAHHNYASLETHYDEEVWVHRKGAICADLGVKGIIPGAMGTYSYIVEGLGNHKSFCSCSHGAGRRMSRSRAKNEISVEKTMVDLKEQGVILGKRNKKDVAEECRFAYKDIEFVIDQQSDLIKPVKILKTLAVIKG
jgi:tRNA-splicing ligase RtcB